MLCFFFFSREKKKIKRASRFFLFFIFSAYINIFIYFFTRIVDCTRYRRTDRIVAYQGGFFFFLPFCFKKIKIKWGFYLYVSVLPFHSRCENGWKDFWSVLNHHETLLFLWSLEHIAKIICVSLSFSVCVCVKEKRKRGDKDLIRHVAERQIDHVYTLWEEKKSWLFIESERGRVRKSKRQGSLTVSTFSFFFFSDRKNEDFFFTPPLSHIDCWRRDNEMRQLKKEEREKRGSRWQQVQWPVCRVTITRSIDRVKQLSRRWQALCGRVSR